MIQRGYGLGFALEALGELLRGNFDRHVAIQTRIARAIHFAHPTGPDNGQDFVRAELGAGSERHVIQSAQFSRLASKQGTYNGAFRTIHPRCS